MKKTGCLLLCLGLVLLELAAGCSSQNRGGVPVVVDPNTRFSTENQTWSGYGFSFEYPNNIRPVERGREAGKAANYDDGILQLKDEAGDNITVSWMKMHKIPPNIPIVYEGFWTSTKNDRSISNVKIYNLQTYPATTCGDATFLGRMSFFDKTRQLWTNEGLLIWYHEPQDRLYSIDIASGEDYFTFIRGNLDRYQQTFRCQ